MFERNLLENLLYKRIQFFLNNTLYDFLPFDDFYDKIKRKADVLLKRKAKVLKCDAKLKIIRKFESLGQTTVEYIVFFQNLIKQDSKIYMEEEQQHRIAVLVQGEIISDNTVEIEDVENDTVLDWAEEEDAPREKVYNRLEAVKYAEIYWNQYNPKYPRFENNCTNYISQCMIAGGASMTGYPKRSRGWWQVGKNYSYSWATANAFYWYLKGAKYGLRGEEVEKPQDLLLGDVICIDFKGVGTFNHTLIVTDKDANGMPLVNANTYNSRHRYWSYEDSTAYTPNIKYKFFRIKI
ncbi:MAG: hypothetical protein K0S34_487 [Bacillales bacterium]|nr:hypothetical protein [Bacillales bacterium]